MKTTTKGFIVPLLLIIVAILLAGGGAYFYTQNKSENPSVAGNVILPQATSTASQTTPPQTSDLKIYSNTKLNISFTYPSNWIVQEDTYRTPAQESEGIAPSIVGIILTPSSKGSMDDYIGLLGRQFDCRAYGAQCYEQYDQIHTKSTNPEVLKVFNDILSQLKAH